MIEGFLGTGHPGSTGEACTDRFAFSAVRLLTEVADVRAGRGQANRSGVCAALAGENPQQGRLACAIRSDETNDVSGGHDHVESGEELAIAMADRQALYLHGR